MRNSGSSVQNVSVANPGRKACIFSPILIRNIKTITLLPVQSMRAILLLSMSRLAFRLQPLATQPPFLPLTTTILSNFKGLGVLQSPMLTLPPLFWSVLTNQNPILTLTPTTKSLTLRTIFPSAYASVRLPWCPYRRLAPMA